MEQKDYLMRYFEQLGAVLAYLMGFRKKGDSKGALELIDESLKDMTSISSAEISEIPEEGLVRELVMNRKLLPEQLRIIAELLYQEAGFLEMGGDTDMAISGFRKSLVLFRHIDKTEKTYSVERADRIQLLEQKTGKHI